nr:hypothetical protein [Tanacetum cinerariifolium]
MLKTLTTSTSYYKSTRRTESQASAVKTPVYVNELCKTIRLSIWQNELPARENVKNAILTEYVSRIHAKSRINKSGDTATNRLVYHDLYLAVKALLERENTGFDLAKSDLCLSFIEVYIVKGVGLRMADSHTAGSGGRFTLRFSLSPTLRSKGLLPSDSLLILLLSLSKASSNSTTLPLCLRDLIEIEELKGLMYHDLYLGWKDLVGRENVIFDMTKSDICSSFIKDHTAKGVGLHMADSHTVNHREDDFTLLETIQRNIQDLMINPSKDAMICNMDSIGKYMLEIIFHQQRTPQLLKQKKLMQTQEDHTNLILALNVDSLKVDLVVIQKICSEKEDRLDSRKGFAVAALKNDLRKLKENSVDTKFAKTSVLGKPILQSLRNQSVVRQPKAFESEMSQMSKQRFASQVDVNNNLSRPVTQYYLPKRGEYVFAKPDHIISSSESRNSSKNMPRFSLNDMVHNHYLDEARKKIQERDMNSKTSTSAVYEKTSPRSDLRWKPTGKIFKSVGLSWIPTGKLFDSCTSKVDSEHPHGSNVDIPNNHASKQTLDLSAGTLINIQKEPGLDLSAEVPSTDTIVMTSMIELESLSGPFFDEYFNRENQIVSKSFVVTTADVSIKRQQQQDSTSST